MKKPVAQVSVTPGNSCLLTAILVPPPGST